jgi:hypothetical protein
MEEWGMIRSQAGARFEPKVIPCQKLHTMSPPSSIAHYRITAKLGEGGMPEERPGARHGLGLIFQP